MSLKNTDKIYTIVFTQESDGYIVEHVHFNCPICGKKYAPTDIYGIDDVYFEFIGYPEMVNKSTGDEWAAESPPRRHFRCESCKSVFSFVSVDGGVWRFRAGNGKGD